MTATYVLWLLGIDHTLALGVEGLVLVTTAVALTLAFRPRGERAASSTSPSRPKTTPAPVVVD